MTDFITLDVLKNAQLVSCLLMIGVIWVIQLVHYPSFFSIDAAVFTDFTKFHRQRISIIVMPLMLLELGTGGILAYAYLGDLFWLGNLVGIAFIWAATMFLSVPCHQRLDVEKDLSTIRRLVSTNWPRTLLWSLRGWALLVYGS